MQVPDSSFSVDWLTASQDHAELLPLLGGDLILFTDPETGELTRSTITGYQHEGSHDTSVRIRCDGHRVEVSGNPSRFGRADNIVGVATVGEAFRVFNDILQSVGLPVFTMGDAYDRTGSRTVQIVDGARISRVDIARNYSAGTDHDACLALRALSGVSRRGQLPQVHPSGSLSSGARGYARVKWYRKGAEMAARNRKSGISDYRHLLTQWATDTGLLRFEVELGRKLLQRHNLNGWVVWDDERAREIADSYNGIHTMSASISEYSEIASILRSRGVTRSRAASAQFAASAWLQGSDLRQMMSKSAFYRVRRDLLDVGVDIGAPAELRSLPLRVRTIDLRPGQVPEWYQHAV